MVQEVTTSAEFRRITSSGKLVVVDFTASWCGPCRMVAPMYEALPQKYPDVTFIKVSDDNGRELIMSEGIQAFPTFRLYHNGQMLEEIRGANIQGLEQAIERHRSSVPQTFGGQGYSLSSGSAAANAEDARLARLRRLGLSPDPPRPTPPPAPSAASGSASSTAPPVAPAPATTTASAAEPTKMEVDGEDDEALLAEALKMSMDAAAATGGEGTGGALTMVEPPVDPAALEQLLELGFTELRAKKAILNGGSSVETAVNWLMEHQEDPDIDDPIPLVPQLDMSALPGAPAPKKRLTAEELQARLEARRRERAEEEKKAEIEREKARRESGKKIGTTKEELERLQREREWAKKKKEKEDYKAERERLKAELAKDKAERMSRSGKLPGKLDAEGYNPPAIQGEYGAPVAPASGGAAAAPAPARRPSDPAAMGPEVAQKAIDIISKQKTAGCGGVALKTLIAYVKNIAENPAEEKFRGINLENNAYKTRVGPVLGSTMLLKSVGFERDDAAGRWFLPADRVDVGLLTDVRSRLEAALAAYQA